MKMTKRILAAACSLTLAASMAACGSSSDSSSSNSSSHAPAASLTDSQKEKINDLQSLLPDEKLENTTIKWLAHYDLNPSDGQVVDPGLQLFKDKYDGKIEYIQTTWDDRYTRLAKAVMANDSPDFFPADDMDAFPKGAIKAMFEPIDDYIDLNSELWAPSKTVCDAGYFNGGHYIAGIDARPQYVCIYNRTTIEDAGFDDPAELYADDKWTWSVFTEMCEEFTNAEEDKYALDGYWYGKALNDTSGYPMIGLENGKLVNNMDKPEITKVQDMMYELSKQNVVFPRSDNNWKTRGDGSTGEGLGSGLTLFIPVGTWAIEGTTESTKIFGDVEGGEVMFVPMPRLDDGDGKYYVSAGIHGFLLCKNAPNPKGFAAYMNCLQVAKQNAADIGEEQLRDEYKWTDEMIEMRKTVYQLAAENPVFDYQEGVTPELSTLMMTVNQATMVTGGGATTWSECVASNKTAVDYLIDECNSNISDVPTDK
ncbi:MAG: extracellular solute-binding protein [Ruminococcus sp.]|nr:extracellular solute-binding protein [Ruminococcus sp.]